MKKALTFDQGLILRGKSYRWQVAPQQSLVHFQIYA